jgi:RES domain-containing protein
VKLKPNKNYKLFLAELLICKSRNPSWQGIVFRAAPLEYARVTRLLDGRGSLRFGGRWSAAGTFRAVNLSTTADTAVREGGAHFSYYGLQPAVMTPRVLVAVRLRLTTVVDLVKPGGLRADPWTDVDAMLAEDWRAMNDKGREAKSQAFGRAAHDAGAEGLLVPSARVPGGVNLVYFPESISEGSDVEILGEEELARWLKPG